MKKVLFLLIALITLIIITGCYDTSNKNYIELMTAEIYDNEGNLLNGEFISDEQIDGFYPYTLSSKKSSSNIQKLNSARPISYIYKVAVALHSEVTVKLSFNIKGNRELTNIDLYGFNLFDIDYTISKDEECTTFTFKIDAVTACNNCYVLDGYTTKENGKEKHYDYIVQGGSRHKRGVFLDIGEYNYLNEKIISFNHYFNAPFALYEDITKLDLSDYNVIFEEIANVNEKVIFSKKGNDEYIIRYTAQYITVLDKELLVITEIYFTDPSVRIFGDIVNGKYTSFKNSLDYYGYKEREESDGRVYYKDNIEIEFTINDDLLNSVIVRVV